MKTRLLMVLGLLVCGTQFGCPMNAMPGGDGDSDLMDADGDGFGELETPEGVDDSQTVSVELVNTLTKDQLADLFDLSSIPLGEVALDAVDVSLTFDLILTYDNGEDTSLTESRQLGPFTIRFEAACPQVFTAVVTVEASISLPIIGTIPLFMQEFPPFEIPQSDTGEGFACNSLISLTSSFDADTGQPDVQFTVEDLEGGDDGIGDGMP